MKFFLKIIPALILMSAAESLSAQNIVTKDSGTWGTEFDTVVVTSELVRLPARVTLPPDSVKDFPVCILLGGSGPTDKDGTLGPTRFLRDLAHGLAERGIASVRYDKRTAVYGGRTAEVSGGRIDYDTEVCEDALAAVSIAEKMFPENAGGIWIVGHSLGAMLAPRVAQQSNARVKGIVALAAPARKLTDCLRDQIDLLAKQQGLSIQQRDDALQQILSAMPQEYLDGDKKYSALETANSLDIPMLFMQGENDYQVTSGDAVIWQVSLAGKQKARIIILPKLNHLFAHSEQMAQPTDYISREHKISAEVLDNAARFILVFGQQK